MTSLELLLISCYGAIAGLLSLYGLHRIYLSAVFLKTRSQHAVERMPAEWPRVTVQLPVFNERLVVVRLIDAVAAMDYPRDRLQVQILDDSTDDTTALARAAAARWRDAGVDMVVLHRTDRTGFKAGALEAGMASATGEFIAVFDADFVPQADFLKRALPCFGPGIGMVQARWGHLNEADSLLTRIQAVLLDGHFVVEHTARHRSGRWFNFNGTAGIWRARAIPDAGGWQHDTLTEDLDLSYRAQLAGWRFVYLPDLVVPAELPPTMRAFKSQQHRWAKGSVQTLRKLAGPLLTADIGWRVKLEALIHLSSNLAYPLVIVLTLLTPAAVQIRGHALDAWLFADVVFFSLATVGVTLFYATSQWAAHADWGRRLVRLPAVLALGIGMAVNQSRAVFEALAGHTSPFVRTPKFGRADGAGYRLSGGWTQWIEIALAAYHVGGLCLALWHGYWPSLAIQVLFACGFGAVGLRSLWPAPPEVKPVAAPERAS